MQRAVQTCRWEWPCVCTNDDGGSMLGTRWRSRLTELTKRPTTSSEGSTAK